jgi:hypothetical protein
MHDILSAYAQTSPKCTDDFDVSIGAGLLKPSEDWGPFGKHPHLNDGPIGPHPNIKY